MQNVVRNSTQSFCQMVSQIVTTKEKSWRKMKSSFSEYWSDSMAKQSYCWFQRILSWSPYQSLFLLLWQHTWQTHHNGLKICFALLFEAILHHDSKSVRQLSHWISSQEAEKQMLVLSRLPRSCLHFIQSIVKRVIPLQFHLPGKFHRSIS